MNFISLQPCFLSVTKTNQSLVIKFIEAASLGHVETDHVEFANWLKHLDKITWEQILIELSEVFVGILTHALLFHNLTVVCIKALGETAWEAASWSHHIFDLCLISEIGKSWNRLLKVEEGGWGSSCKGGCDYSELWYLDHIINFEVLNYNNVIEVLSYISH